MKIIKLNKNTIIILTVALLVCIFAIGQINSNRPKSKEEVIKELIKAGNYQKAAEILTSISKDKNSDVKNRILIAWMYAFNKKSDKAIEISDEIIKRNPNYQEIYYLRGFVFQENRNFQSAIANFVKAVQLDPRDIKSISALAEIYQELKNYDKAIYYYQQALKLYPKNYIYHLGLAEAYLSTSNFSQALNEAQLAYNYAPASDKDNVQDTLENIKLNAVLKQNK